MTATSTTTQNPQATRANRFGNTLRSTRSAARSFIGSAWQISEFVLRRSSEAAGDTYSL